MQMGCLVLPELYFISRLIWQVRQGCFRCWLLSKMHSFTMLVLSTLYFCFLSFFPPPWKWNVNKPCSTWEWLLYGGVWIRAGLSSLSGCWIRETVWAIKCHFICQCRLCRSSISMQISECFMSMLGLKDLSKHWFMIWAPSLLPTALGRPMRVLLFSNNVFTVWQDLVQ